MSVTFLLGRRMVRAGFAAEKDTVTSMRILYVGAVQRFLLVLVLFAFGLAVLELQPLAMIVGFVLVQFAYLADARKVD